MRIFTDMGRLVDLQSAETILPARVGSFRIAEPEQFFITFDAGQPMFMSIPQGRSEAGRLVIFFPASAKNSGSFPNNWVISGCSLLLNSSIFSVFFEPCSMALMLVSSEKHTMFGSISFTI